MGVLLPSLRGTSLGFLRDILKDEKLHLKSNEVIHSKVPLYNELAVKNLYPDAMKDPQLSKYLPSLEQMSNKLPERDFFFGIMCTLKRQYMVDVVQQAHSNRFKLADDDPGKRGILITDTWLEELNKHPYYSSKLNFNVIML